jgi:hypothetical protein
MLAVKYENKSFALKRGASFAVSVTVRSLFLEAFLVFLVFIISGVECSGNGQNNAVFNLPCSVDSESGLGI